MQKLLKKIRTHLNMSQTELAACLNVSFATINRWENGRAVPNKLAQSRLCELCKEKSIAVYDMILEKIAEMGQQIQLEPGRTLLYHGSKFGIEGPIEPKSRKQCDFGSGFYMGTDPGQALTLICDFEKSKFYMVSINMEELDYLDVPANIDWAMLMYGKEASNRKQEIDRQHHTIPNKRTKDQKTSTVEMCITCYSVMEKSVHRTWKS